MGTVGIIDPMRNILKEIRIRHMVKEVEIRLIELVDKLY
jgi:hypothetical protein